MAINSLMGTALSGMQAAQTVLASVSDNITNVNTPGYARKVVDESSVVAAGAGIGVTVDDIRRVTNQFLEQANYQSSAAAGSSNIIANLLDQAQSAFGDPTKSTSYLDQLNSVFTDFAAAANDPASGLPRSQTIDDLTTFLDSTQTVAGTLSGLNTQAETQINSDIAQVNQLLSQINDLNTQIVRTSANGADITGTQDNQSQLLGQLSSLISVNVATQKDGTVVVRSATGQLLAGQGGAATLSYSPSVSALGSISFTPPNSTQPMALDVGDGELQGLMSLRNNLIPGIQAQLAEYVSGSVAAINAAHNANTSAPPQQTLQGRNTGLDLPTIVSDFSGKTNIAVVGSTGLLQQQVTIDFSAQTMSVNGGAATAFTPANFLSSLNTALGGAATASFSGGALSLTASAAGSGVAIADDATTPARDGGQGFSQFFGLNDLLTSSEITNYNTGLKATDANGFTPGGKITLQIADSTGNPVSTVTVSVPAASSPTMQDLLNALNAPVGGVGQYGSFSLDANGAMTFTPMTAGGATVAVVSDGTQRGAGGPSVSELFGLGITRQAGRASTFQIRPDIVADPMNLALAKLNLSAPAGQPVVAVGDGSGATALSQVAQAQTGFAAAGAFGAVTTSVTQYAANIGGDIGRKANTAANASAGAKALQTETNTRLQSVEGVNLDEELVNLTTFQQAYSASARLVQASKDMIDTLLGMMN
jgi:flagellar hook-associated protein 1 FlgK